MAGDVRDDRYVLIRMDEQSWAIHDLTLSAPAAHPVAELHASGDDDDTIVVMWITPTPLPVRYARAEDTIADFVLWERRALGVTKPIPIPHRPPPQS